MYPTDAFYHAYAFVSRLTDDVTASSASLAESLALHKQVAFGGDCEPRAENEVWKSEKVKALHTAVRSLDLHLLAALQRWVIYILYIMLLLYLNFISIIY